MLSGDFNAPLDREWEVHKADLVRRRPRPHSFTQPL